MTRFRYPDGWNTRREPGERPDLTGTWLSPENVKTYPRNSVARKSATYWLRIHWATPPWVTPQMWEQMRDTYERSRPPLDEVDHIVPLSHPLVCGLNVPWNLRRVPKRVNQSKKNFYWPDCPDHLCPRRNLPRDMYGGPEPHQLGLAL